MNVVAVTGSLRQLEEISVIALSAPRLDAQAIPLPLPLEKRRIRLVVNDPQQRELLSKALLGIKTRILWAATAIETLLTLLRLRTGGAGRIVLQPLGAEPNRGFGLQTLPFRSQFMPLQLEHYLRMDRARIQRRCRLKQSERMVEAPSRICQDIGDQPLALRQGTGMHHQVMAMEGEPLLRHDAPVTE